MTLENGMGPPGLEAARVHRASRLGSSHSVMEWPGLLRLQEADLEPSSTEQWEGKRMSLKPPL